MDLTGGGKNSDKPSTSSSQRGNGQQQRRVRWVPAPLSPVPTSSTESPLSGRSPRNNSSDEDAGFHDLETPPTPMLVLRPDATSPPGSPDTESNVAHQSSGMFRQFVLDLHGRRVAATTCGTRAIGAASVEGNDGLVDDDDGLVTELTSDGVNVPLPDEMMTPEMRVGRQLAMIGDDVNARYSSEFNKMVRLLNVGEDTAYDGFAAVARQLFSDGIINWGRIIVLLCFGYRVVATAVRSGFGQLFTRFFNFVIDFIVRERIAGWVAAQGGWVAALRYIPENVGMRTISVIVGVAAVCVMAAIYLSRSH